MNFEDNLKNLTASARKEECRKNQEAEQLRIKYETEDKNILKTKDIIESVFRSVQKYYPNANFEPTHTVENGKIIPYMGTYQCCFLLFDKNELYKFPYSSAISFRVSFNDDPNIINIASANIDRASDYANYRVELLSILKQAAMNNELIYSGILDDKLIKESVEKVITEFLSHFK